MLGKTPTYIISPKNVIMQKKNILYSILFLFSFNSVFSQCAGIKNTVNICDKELDINNQSYNLFNQLLGTPLTGGKWSSENPVNKFALNLVTGEVDLWAINRSGEHKFTYTNVACGESATVTVFLGGYPGEDNIKGGANACSDDNAVNLYTFLDNALISLNADTNGKWSEVPLTATGFLSDQFFDAEKAGPGSYEFIYTTNIVNTCVSEIANIKLQVHRAPKTGEPIDLIICETDDFSLYTNVNLFDLLIGEDPDGVWKDNSGTNQITSNSDSFINIEDIYKLRGPGNYSFEYTLYSKHGVCSEESEIVTISIPNVTAKFNIQNTCKQNSLNVDIEYLSTSEIAFKHNLEYEIRNFTTDNLVYTGTINDIGIKTGLSPIIPPTGNFEGKYSFFIDPNPILVAGKYYITTKKISNLRDLTCSSLKISNNTFTIYDPKYVVAKKCFDGNDAIINISNIIDSSGNLSNDDVIIDYTLKDLTNDTSIDIKGKKITFINGVSTLPVNISTFPKNTENYNIEITNPDVFGLSCIALDFEAYLVPEDIKLNVLVDNSCNATKVQVSINAPPMKDGEYTVTYEVKEVTKTDILIKGLITFKKGGGSTNLNVDIATLKPGNYEVVLKSTQNDTAPCRKKSDFVIKSKFSIGGIPDAPLLDNNQIFCLSKYLPNQPKISDITVTSGTNLTWYENTTSTTPLNTNDYLVDGNSYFVSASDPKNSCESSSRSFVTVKVVTTSNILSTNTSPSFCSLDKVTLASFNAIANAGNVLWYDAETAGNLLDINTVIESGKNYYAVENLDGCEHNNKLLFTATITTSPKPIYIGSSALCALDNLTLFDLETNITPVSGFELAWFDSKVDGTELNNTDLLEENINYYVTYKDLVTGCEGERTLITVILSECTPDKYAFFIPDGFSPNNDGTNDYYFIPNIEYFYPKYELEIFNRYGQSLFKGDIKSPKWNGTVSSGNEATSGVYFYILRYNKDDLKPKQGRIYLSK